MSTISKRKLSGSTSGLPIKVAATATPGTTIHQATSGTGAADDYDEVWLWACNTDTSARKLTIEYGGTTAPDCLIEVTIPAEGGLVLVVPGLLLQNSLTITAFAAAANVINVVGFVNRIAP